MAETHVSHGRLRGDLVLLLVALLWGTAFVVQRVAAAHMGPFFYTGIRFLLGGAILLPWAGWPWRGLDGRDRRDSLSKNKAERKGKRP